MMELENIVANTVYIKAKEKKTYGFIIDNQPIGKRLMWQYCRNISEYSPLVDFQDKVDEFMVSRFEDRNAIAHDIVKSFLTNDRISLFNEKDVEVVILQLEASSTEEYPPKDLFAPLLKSIAPVLEGPAFQGFLASIYFERFLQWKWLERQPVTKHTFRMYRVLGKGGFGEVCACQVRATGKLYACKKLDKKRIKKRNGSQMAYTEKSLLEQVNSPFVVSLAYAFETKDSLCLVLTIMNGGDLRFHIHSLNPGTGFSEDRARFYAAEILLGLEHLHSLRIVYRDMKPCNILIDDQGHVRISDLGLAKIIEPGRCLRGRFGTLGYMAPEVLNNRDYTFSPDWFGYGCIVFEMIMGLAPFRKRRNERLRRDMFDRRVCQEPEEYNEKFSEHAKSLCQALLAKQPEDRLGCDSEGARAVKAHAWFDRLNWQRIEAKLEEPPFRPDLHAVYAKDVLDIEQFSTVRGVHIKPDDRKFYQNFCTGAVSIPWQNQMIETECFDDLNEFYEPDGVTLVANLDPKRPPPPKRETNLCGCASRPKNKPYDPVATNSPVSDRIENETAPIHRLCDEGKAEAEDALSNDCANGEAVSRPKKGLQALICCKR